MKGDLATVSINKTVNGLASGKRENKNVSVCFPAPFWKDRPFPEGTGNVPCENNIRVVHFSSIELIKKMVKNIGFGGRWT